MEIAQSDLTGLLQAHTNLLLQVACSLLSKDVFFVWTCGDCPLRLVAMTLTQDLQAHDYAVLQLPIAAAPRIDRTPGHLEGNSRIDMHWSWVRYLRSISNRKIPVPFRFWILFKTWEVMKMIAICRLQVCA